MPAAKPETASTAFVGMPRQAMSMSDVLDCTGGMLDSKGKAGAKRKRTKAAAEEDTKAAAEEDEDDDKEDADEDQEEDEGENEELEVPKKKGIKAPVPGSKKEAAAPGPAPKKKAAAKAAASAAAAEPKDPTILEYKGIKKHGPRKYGCCTIYTAAKMWRLKPSAGSKDLSHYSWKIDDPKKVWAKLVGDVKRLTR